MLRIAKIEDENYRLSVVETKTELTPMWENLGYSLIKCEKAWDGNYYPIGRSPIEPPEHRAKIRTMELKKFLQDTDYICMKLAEGAATTAEYADTLAKREAARVEIRELEPLVGN